MDESPESKFDFVYDYTFLCALNPILREDWARKMAALVKEGGELLTLIFPIREKPSNVPPFMVSLELYRELLEPVGFEAFQLELLPPELCHEGRDGSENPDHELTSLAKSGIGRWRRLPIRAE